MRSVPVLAGLLADEKVAHWARITLERIPDPSVPEALRAALPKLKGRLLAGAILSLGARPSAATGKNADSALLAGYLRDADPEVASAAANALREAVRLQRGEQAIGSTDGDVGLGGSAVERHVLLVGEDSQDCEHIRRGGDGVARAAALRPLEAFLGRGPGADVDIH